MGRMANTLRGLLLAPLLLSQPAWCDIYRWLDENGQVQFGDRPPAETKAEIEPVELSLPPADPERADDYSIQKQLERMEQARAERAAARPEPAPLPPSAPAPAAAPSDERTYWGPGYYWPPPRPRPPIHPPRPHPPEPGRPLPAPKPQPSGRLHLPGGITVPPLSR